MNAPIAIERTRTMSGSTPWCAQPSLVVILRASDGEAAEGLLGRVEQAFRPHLEGEAIDPAMAASAVQIVSQLCHLLPQAQGMPVFARPAPTRMRPGLHRIAVPTQTGQHQLAHRMVLAVVDAVNALATGVAIDKAMAEVAAVADRLARDAPGGKNMIPMLAAADKAGIPWERMPGGIYRLGIGARARWFRSSITDRTPSLAVSLAKTKHDTAAILRRQNIPVADHFLVRTEEEALDAARRLGFPVVVKPADQDRGTGVASRLRTEEAVRRAYREAAQHSKSILVERHFFGEDHRIHVFEGEVFRVRHRVPGGVTGDGVQSVSQLLAVLNADPRRGEPGSADDLIRIDMDDEAMELLAERGLAPDSVPAAGDYVQLRRIANVSVGGVSHPVAIEDVHPDNLALAVRAVAALKLDLAAVDFLIPDIRQSWFDVGAAICEINAQPQFGADAPEWLFARMFPGQGRVPAVVVAGEVGWIANVREQAAALGVRLGYADAAGTWVGDARISGELPRGVFQGAAILAGEDVDAILLVADDAFGSRGMPIDRFDAMVQGSPGTSAHHAEMSQAVARASAAVLQDGPDAAAQVLRLLASPKAKAA